MRSRDERKPLPVTDQPQREPARPSDLLEPVHVSEARAGSWSDTLVLFLRIMAVVWLAKGLYHWAQICGLGASSGATFEMQSLGWQSATVLFAVIDPVAAVGLWLNAAWGAVVWLTSVVSLAVVEVFFPEIYGGGLYIVLTETGLLAVYLWLAIMAARERPR
jgi:hypothetical protein